MKKTRMMIRFAMVLMTALMGFAFTDQTQPEGDALLWKVTGKGAQPSYVLATCSAVEISFVDSIPGATAALGKVKKVLMPFDATTLRDAMTQMAKQPKPELIEVQRMPADTTYAQLLSETDMHRLNDILQGQLHEGAQQAYMFKPLTLYGLVSVFKQMKNGNTLVQDIQKSMSYEFKDMAISKGLEVDYLSSGQEMVDMMTELQDSAGILMYSTPLKVQAEVLHEELVKPTDSDTNTSLLSPLQQMAKCYKSLHLSQMEPNEEWMTLAKKVMPADERKRFAERHQVFGKNWIPTIEAAMSQQPTMVTMEANGLLGAEGLLARLCAAGYKVEPVTE